MEDIFKDLEKERIDLYNQIKKLQDNGMSFRAIALHLNLSLGKVQRTLKGGVSVGVSDTDLKSVEGLEKKPKEIGLNKDISIGTQGVLSKKPLPIIAYEGNNKVDEAYLKENYVSILEFEKFKEFIEEYLNVVIEKRIIPYLETIIKREDVKTN